MCGGDFFLIVALISILLLGTVFGFNPIPELSKWEIPRSGAPSQIEWENYDIKEANLLGFSELQLFEGKYGREWLFQVNHPTGTYHHIYGAGIDMGKR